MADEKKKVEIEDLPESEETTSNEIDLEEAVLEDVEDADLEEEENRNEKDSDVSDTEEQEEVEPEEEKDVLEKVIEDTEAEETDETKDVVEDLGKSGSEKPEKKVKKSETKLKHKQVKRSGSGSKNKIKIVVAIAVTMLVTAAAVLGVLYYLDQRNTPEEVLQDTQNEVVEEVVEQEEVVEEESGSVYILSAVGLNLRKEPNTSSEVLIIIPFGTKVPVLAEEDGWIQTEYDDKDGWVSADFTQEESPLIYTNDDYGFTLTFKPSWAGYKVIKEKQSSNSTATATYSVFVPTTDTDWVGIDTIEGSAHYNPFIISIFTPSEWAKIEAGDGPKPTVLDQNSEYVFVSSHAHDAPSDFIDNFDESSKILDTFELI